MECILEEFPLFDGISIAVLKQIAERTNIEKYKRNSVVIMEGEENETFYLIKSGEVKVFREDAEEGVVTLAILGEGDFFGEMSILEANETSATVMTTQPTEVITFHARHFIHIMKRYPKVASRMFLFMSKRIRYCDESIRNLNRGSCGDRIAAVIVHLAEKNGYRKQNSVVIKRLPFNHVIASLAGTSRESVYRTLARMENNEYVIKTGRELVINDYPRFYEKYST